MTNQEIAKILEHYCILMDLKTSHNKHFYRFFNGVWQICIKNDKDKKALGFSNFDYGKTQYVNLTQEKIKEIAKTKDSELRNIVL